MVDDIAIIRSMHTDAINHEPAITFLQTGFMIAGKPCIGSWLAYGLGSMNQSLPTFVVLNATHSNPKANVQAISARLWSAGFLRANTPAWRCVPVAIPYCTSTIRMACRSKSAAACWMRWAN